jgi:hypothetical protein
MVYRLQKSLARENLWKTAWIRDEGWVSQQYHSLAYLAGKPQLLDQRFRNAAWRGAASLRDSLGGFGLDRTLVLSFKVRWNPRVLLSLVID